MARCRAILALLLFVAACGRRADRVVVGAATSPEQRILGEVIAQQLERRTHLPIERAFRFDNTVDCHRAQGSGKIDVYAEYTLTALVDILRHRPVGDPGVALNLVAREFAERFRVIWLPPLGAEGRIAPVARGEALRLHPEVRAALGELSGALPDSALARLVALVSVQHREPAAVAREFLAGLGAH
jgi:glycine betaine/choline ABC-type transport system substrate-binding protein